MRRWAAVLALAVVAAGAIDLGVELARLRAGSAQIDFAAYWAAGRASGRGLSPYVNHVVRDPALWDGVASHRHSRFLYPPLTARAFQPLGALDYWQAKQVWMSVCLLAGAAALVLALRWARVRGAPAVLAVVGFALWFFPLRALLERGQVDLLTLALITGALLADRRGRWLGAGALLAAATLFKLYTGFLLPFLLLRRRWRTAAAFAGAGIALLLLSLALDGGAALRGYAFDELPRIARWGEGGSRETRLDAGDLQAIAGGLEPGSTVIDGSRYPLEAFSFTLNASAVRTPFGRALWDGARAVGLPLAPGHVSWLLLAAALAGTALWLRRAPGLDDATFGAAALILILLVAPVTWTMNVVWLLPVAALVAARGWPAGSTARAGTLLCAAGLLLTLPPDSLLPLGDALRYRYVLALTLALAGLVVSSFAGPSASQPGGQPSGRPPSR